MVGQLNSFRQNNQLLSISLSSCLVCPHGISAPRPFSSLGEIPFLLTSYAIPLVLFQMLLSFLFLDNSIAHGPNPQAAFNLPDLILEGRN